MDLGKLASNFLGSEAGKKVKAQVATKVAKTVKEKAGLDISSAIGLASKNTEIIDLLGNIGVLKKTVEPESTKAQKLVKKLYSLVTENVGKIDNPTFKSIITKLLASDTVKKQIEKIAGSGTTTFIKNAIVAYLSK